MVGQVAVRRAVENVGDFIASGLFAVSILSIAMAWSLAMGAIAFWPDSFVPAASWILAFKTWCFGYDPLKGTMDASKLAMFILDPIFLLVLVSMTWKKDLLHTLKHQWKLVIAIFLLSVASVVMALTSFGKSAYIQSRLAENSGLYRQEKIAPALHLMDQDRKVFDIRDGQVTVVAAFYAHCEHTCPLTVTQLKKAFEKLSPSERDKIDVALITLDPQRDTIEVLSQLSQNSHLGPRWHYLTGSVESVNRTLDGYQVARSIERDGTIGHSSVFNLIDKRGRLAYRVSLSADDSKLTQALKLLAAEGY